MSDLCNLAASKIATLVFLAQRGPASGKRGGMV